MGGKSGGQVVGYKYIMGIHLGLAHEIDCVAKIFFDKKQAWPNSGTGDVIDGEFSVTAAELFGGEQREGGVEGVMSLLPGHSDQVLTGSIQQVYNVAGESPGFRGIATLFSNRFYFGMNPYLKPISLLVSRIFTREFGKTQWYPDKAAIPREPSDVVDCGTTDDFFFTLKVYHLVYDILGPPFRTIVHQIYFLFVIHECPGPPIEVQGIYFNNGFQGNFTPSESSMLAAVASYEFYFSPTSPAPLDLPETITVCFRVQDSEIIPVSVFLYKWDRSEFIPGSIMYKDIPRPIPPGGFEADRVAVTPPIIEIINTDYSAPFEIWFPYAVQLDFPFPFNPITVEMYKCNP